MRSFTYVCEGGVFAPREDAFVWTDRNLGPLRPFNVKPGERNGGALPDANPVFNERTTGPFRRSLNTREKKIILKYSIDAELE